MPVGEGGGGSSASWCQWGRVEVDRVLAGASGGGWRWIEC